MRSSAPGRHAERSVWLVLLLLTSSCFVAYGSRPHLDLPSAAGAQHKAAHVRTLTQQVASSVNSLHVRQLQQTATCPDGCRDDSCITDGTVGGYRCQMCKNNLVVSKTDGSCACPAGKYSKDGAESCTDCPKGFWCPGGKFSVADPPQKFACPDGMTTLGLRSTSARACVNLPGYSYSITAEGEPSAILCPENTYGPGLKKQRACVPCPTAFTTDGGTGLSRPSACVVPAGYYLKSPGQAVPCPKGEFKAGTGSVANCTKCAFGVTTAAEASTAETACSILLPGYYASRMSGSIITAVSVCPQKFYCRGGVPVRAFDPDRPTWIAVGDNTIRVCPDGTWTQNIASVDAAQCMTPPGYKTVGGATTPCGDNEWRAEWKNAADATTCSSCGSGVLMAKTDRLTMYDINNNNTEVQIPVATSADDCYIRPGQGLMFNSIEKTWRAVNCDKDNYGVTNITYGLTPAPCKPCPQNMVATTNASYPNSASWYRSNGDNTGGFISPSACVNRDGYGYNGRTSQKCDKGFYNQRDNALDCKPCGFAMTTAAVGSGVTFDDCGIAPGHGYGTTQYLNRSLILCPVGFYNDRLQLNKTTPCTQCPTGTTSSVEGSETKDECDLCLPGWGGDKCATQCGGYGANATYGPPGRKLSSDCISCNDVLSYYSYQWQAENDVWGAPVVSRIGADNAADCLASFVQVVDGAWYLPVPTGAGVTTTPNISTFADCVALCNDTCQFVTYDYINKDCSVRVSETVVYEGAPYVAFKGMMAGAAGASSVHGNSSSTDTVSGKKADYGQYTIWWDANAATIGRQEDAPNAGSFDRMQDCMTACDYDRKCAGITVQSTLHEGSNYNNVGPKTCKLIYGDDRFGQYKRTVIRADPSKVEIPVYMRVCREEPGPVFHGTWPISCRGTPVGGTCLAVCDCTPDECYSRDGCPTTICQADGTWGPFVPETCALAIPAQPPAVSCPTTIRSGTYTSRRRTLLEAVTSSAAPTPTAPLYTRPTSQEVEAGKAEFAARVAAAKAAKTASGGSRNLVWDPPTDANSFDARLSSTIVNCPADTSTPYAVMPDARFGQMIHDNWLCNGHPTGAVIGIAAQDFQKGYPWIRNKFEDLPKWHYDAYVWAMFDVPMQPNGDGTSLSSIQGMQLMVVGNVGTDHPCQAVCAITAVDLAIYSANADTLEPEGKLYHNLIRLNGSSPTTTFQWSYNETAVLNVDVAQDSNPMRLLENNRYWMRVKLQVPFNGTDDSGDARCYAYVATKDTLKFPDYPPRWQEFGGYGSTCNGVSNSVLPEPLQTVGNCTNGGGPGISTLDMCTLATSSNTCAPTKYGADVPRTCPFAAQDIVFAMYGFSGDTDPGGSTGGGGGGIDDNDWVFDR